MSQSLNSQPHAGKMPSAALTDKVPNEERGNGQEDEKPRENANQDSGLLLRRLLLVAEEVDLLMVVAVPTLVQKTREEKNLRKHTHTCHSLRRVNVYFTLNKSAAGS